MKTCLGAVSMTLHGYRAAPGPRRGRASSGGGNTGASAWTPSPGPSEAKSPPSGATGVMLGASVSDAAPTPAAVAGASTAAGRSPAVFRSLVVQSGFPGHRAAAGECGDDRHLRKRRAAERCRRSYPQPACGGCDRAAAGQVAAGRHRTAAECRRAAPRPRPRRRRLLPRRLRPPSPPTAAAPPVEPPPAAAARLRRDRAARRPAAGPADAGEDARLGSARVSATGSAIASMLR